MRKYLLALLLSALSAPIQAAGPELRRPGVASTGGVFTGTITVQGNPVVASAFIGNGSQLTGVNAMAVGPGGVDFSTITTALSGKLSNTQPVPPGLVDLSTVTSRFSTVENSTGILRTDLENEINGRNFSDQETAASTNTLSASTAAINAAKLNKSSDTMTGPLTIRGTDPGLSYALWVTTSTNNRGLVVGGATSSCPGCVGIGTPSAGGLGLPLSAGENLQVNGLGRVGSNNSSGGASVAFRTQNPNSPAVSGASVRVGLRVGTNSGNRDVAGIGGLAEDVAVSSGALILLTNAAGAGSDTLTERARITSSGRMGIGKTNPSTTLDVNGAINTNSSVTASAFFGDGSGLTNLPGGESNTFTSSKTFTGDVLINGILATSNIDGEDDTDTVINGGFTSGFGLGFASALTLPAASATPNQTRLQASGAVTGGVGGQMVVAAGDAGSGGGVGGGLILLAGSGNGGNGGDAEIWGGIASGGNPGSVIIKTDNVTALTINPNQTVTVSTTINAGYFVGNGSGLTNLPLPVFGTQHSTHSTEGLQTTTSLTFIGASTMTTPSLPAGIYYIEGYSEGRNQGVGFAIQRELVLNGSVIAETRSYSGDAGGVNWQADFVGWTAHRVVELSGVNTIALRYRSEGGSTSEIQRVRFRIYRVN